MSGELADGPIARVEQDGRVLSGGTDSAKLTETMERHAPEPTPAAGTETVPAVTEGAAVAPAPDVKPTRGQARFSELAKARDAATARADAAEARAKELEAKISAPPAAAAEPVKPAAAAEPAKPVEKFKFPGYDDAYLAANPGKSYDEWEIERLDAYAEWRDQRNDINARIAQGIDAREAYRAEQARVEQTRTKGREAYPDFDTVLKSGPGAGVNMHATDPDRATARCAFIFGHSQSEHLQYAIMKDAELANRLAGMDDIAFGLELAKIAAPVAQQPPRRAAVPPPPAPYTPVNGSGPTVSPPSAELAKKGNFDAYRNKRAQERGVKPRY